ncbi:MAG TPA: autotransporter domain-containing protein [Sedimentisphaerales bacterium]|nr:autotransporter domain-containing protein [Sedimentisphaerales bacterium]
MMCGGKRRSVVCAVVVVTLWGLICGSPVRATITVTGDIEPLYDASDPWTPGVDYLYISEISDANLVVSGSSRVSGENVFIGWSSLATGRANVLGPDAILESTGELRIGSAGTGYLQIRDGGRVTSLYGRLGALVGSEGHVEIAGAGSLWEVQDLYVGDIGDANLAITGGGALESTNAYVAYTNGDAQVNVSGAGSTWTVTGDLDVGRADTGVVTVSDGGRIDSTTVRVGMHGPGECTITGPGSVWVMADLYAGLNNDANLTISDAGRLLGGNSYLGTVARSATATVEGAGSSWENTGSLVIGDSSTGTMNVLDGGLVTSHSASIGRQASAEGAVLVRGAVSLWQNEDALYVGDYGRGQLTISEGGRVESGSVRIGYHSSEQSQVTVTGPGSLLQATSHVSVGSGARLDVNDGGRVTSVEASTGGTVRIAGAGSRWTSSYWLNVSHGDLTIEDGGQLVCGSSGVQVLSGEAVGIVVSDANSLWDNEGELRFGYRGDANLLVSDGGRVTSGGAYVEGEEEGTAIVTVTGADSRWTNTGTLTVGDRAYSGPLAMYDPAGYGTILVSNGGVVESDDMTVWEGSVLTGDGVFDVAQTTNHGIIRPGNSIGTLTFDGDLAMDSNSVLETEIDNSGHNDKLIVTGDVTIAGGAVRVVPTETITSSQQYEILDANSVSGEFASLDVSSIDPRTLLRISGLDYEDGSLQLMIAPTAFDDPNIARTGNHVSLGSVLQQVAEEGGNDITTALQQLQTGGSVETAYNQLSGQTIPSLAPVTVAGTTRHVGAIAGRLRNPARGIASGDGLGESSMGLTAGDTVSLDAGRYLFAVGNDAPVLSEKPWGVWGKGYGLYGDRESESGAPGYTYTVYGTAFGLDYRFTERLLLGFTAGYSQGDIDYSGSRDSSDVSATHGGVYGGYETPQWYLDSVLTYTDLEYETRRYVDLLDERLEADPSGNMLTGYLEAGLNWRRWERTLIQPLAGLQVSTLKIDRFTETGGDAALTFDDERYDSYKGSLGVRITRELFDHADGARMELELRGRWVHEFGDTKASFDVGFASDPGATFRVSDEDIARDSAVLGAGLDTWFTRQARVFLDYGTELNPDHTVHVVTAGLEHRW